MRVEIARFLNDRLDWNLLREDISLPSAVLYEGRLTHNLHWMQHFIAAYGLKLAPHGKTTMAPHLFRRQLETGAWGITLATAHQVRAAYHGGVSRILMANQLVGRRNMLIIAEMLSDPVALTVAPLGEVAVSVYAPGDTGPASAHSMALRTTWVSKEGDFTAAPEFTDAATSQSWYWVSALDVAAPADAGAIVAFGDSITDGATSSPNTDRSWPSVLAQRLQCAHSHHQAQRSHVAWHLARGPPQRQA